MFSNISKIISWLKLHHNTLRYINRGIERETLRITKSGKLSDLDYPKSIGSSLTHPWITTDFAESLLEFITPVHKNVNHLLSFLRDLHIHTLNHLNNELIWPFSMPCYISNQDEIKIAKYGNSNIGKFKTLYREGLKNRYGAIMQTIAGTHYNFSLPIEFWQAFIGIKDYKSGKKEINKCYLKLIRNYYRFGWIITYLFGSSPAICKSFLQEKQIKLPFEKAKYDTYYLPYATSLRISQIGYTNQLHSKIKITYNNILSYVNKLKKYLNISSPEFKKIGILNQKKQYIQINTNILQTENELYIPIRPKRILSNNDSLINSLLKYGIEYIEIRDLDINPFSPIGINTIQIHFLDLFLIWCLLTDAPKMDAKETNFYRENWNHVIINGRKPGQLIKLDYKKSMLPIKNAGEIIFEELFKIANILDKYNNTKYQEICSKLVIFFENPELTYSAKVLRPIIKYGFHQYGLKLANSYHKELIKEKYELLTKKNFIDAKINSKKQLLKIEKNDNMSFDDFLKLKTNYNNNFIIN